jgi:hypothetical protein
MTQIFCDRCGDTIRENTNPVNVSGIDVGKKDLCGKCLSQLKRFFDPIPQIGQSKE